MKLTAAEERSLAAGAELDLHAVGRRVRYRDTNGKQFMQTWL